MEQRDFLENFSSLPPDVRSQILDFADFVTKKRDISLQHMSTDDVSMHIRYLVDSDVAFDFLHEDDYVYTADDAVERFRA